MLLPSCFFQFPECVKNEINPVSSLLLCYTQAFHCFLPAYCAVPCESNNDGRHCSPIDAKQFSRFYPVAIVNQKQGCFPLQVKDDRLLLSFSQAQLFNKPSFFRLCSCYGFYFQFPLFKGALNEQRIHF